MSASSGLQLVDVQQALQLAATPPQTSAELRLVQGVPAQAAQWWMGQTQVNMRKWAVPSHGSLRRVVQVRLTQSPKPRAVHDVVYACACACARAVGGVGCHVHTRT